MNFQPKTREQLNQQSRLPDGEYDFEVLESKDTKSKAGNDMIEMVVKVWTGEGDRFRIITDYLLEAMSFKLINFCEATGLSERYIAGQLKANDCAGRVGKCKIGWKVDRTGDFPDKNVIKDYIHEANKELKKEEKQEGNPEDSDDVPFVWILPPWIIGTGSAIALSIC